MATGLVVIAFSVSAHAQEKDLNEGHPVALGDAFPITIGDGSLLSTGSAVVPTRGPARGLFQIDLQYGLFPRTQVSVSTILSTLPSQTRDPASGDLTLATKIGLGPETGPWPLFAAQLGTTLPTGMGSRSIDLQLKGYATKSLVLGLVPIFLHLNAAGDFRVTERGSDERLARFHFAAGPSCTVPPIAGMTLVADVFVDQSIKHRDRDTIGIEAGLRYRLTPRIAVHGAIGSEISGPSDRAGFFARVGLSANFSRPTPGWSAGR